MLTLRAIDAHAGGAVLRVITEGFPAPRGRTMHEKLRWATRHGEAVRRAAVLEPRGDRDLSGAVLTEPVNAGSHAGVLFMHAGSFASAVHHGVVALTTVALERGLIAPGGDGDTVVFDTVAGVVRVRATISREEASLHALRVRSVTCSLPPAFVVGGGVPVRVLGRTVPADLAYAGACHAVVDGETAGVGLTPRHVPEMRRVGAAILDALAGVPFVHPADPGLRGVHGVVFTGPSDASSADVRGVLVMADGQIAVSPTESGAGAMLAVLDAIGLLADGGRLTIQGLTGTTWSARISSRSQVGEFDAIVPEITGAAWITGDHSFVVAADDPLGNGFVI